MFEPIPDPIADKPIIAWAAPVTRALNAIGDKVGATARNERNRRGSASPDMGCWKIVSDTREEEGENEGETVEKPVRVFANQYYLDGEVLRQLELEDGFRMPGRAWRRRGIHGSRQAVRGAQGPGDDQLDGESGARRIQNSRGAADGPKRRCMGC